MKINYLIQHKRVLESEITFLGKDQYLSIVSHFAKSRTATSGPNSRRPDVSYGVDYSKKFNLPEYGLI